MEWLYELISVEREIGRMLKEGGKEYLAKLLARERALFAKLSGLIKEEK